MNKNKSILPIFLGMVLILGVLVLADPNYSNNPNKSPQNLNPGYNNSATDPSKGTIETQGIIEFLEIEGGCWVIKGDEGIVYQPINLDSAYQIAGIRVKFEGTLRDDLGSICNSGDLVEITKMSLNKNEFELRERIRLNQSEKTKIMSAEHRLKFNSTNSSVPENCTRSGSSLKCWLEDGTRVMTIYAGNSGNTIIQIKGINASTNVTLYKSDGKLYGEFKNETRKIILPDEAMDRAKEKIKYKLHNESINLTEDGKYEIQARKRVRFLYLFGVEEKIRTSVDAETGEVINTQSPWWEFLARDSSEKSDQ